MTYANFLKENSIFPHILFSKFPINPLNSFAQIPIIPKNSFRPVPRFIYHLSSIKSIHLLSIIYHLSKKVHLSSIIYHLSKKVHLSSIIYHLSKKVHLSSIIYHLSKIGSPLSYLLSPIRHPMPENSVHYCRISSGSFFRPTCENVLVVPRFDALMHQNLGLL